MAMSVPGNSCRPCRSSTSTAGCILRLSGECVYYSGSNIAGPSINTGDVFNLVVNKLVTYIQGSGSSGTVTSVGLTMPSAFSVTGSPITSSGTFAVTGAGTTSQYIAGDGSLITSNTYNNGLTKSLTVVQLGGTLIQATTITTAGNAFVVSNNTSISALRGVNSAAGGGLEGNNTSSGPGVLGTSVSGVGGAFSSSTSTAVTAQSNSSTALLTSGTLGAQLGAFNTATLNNSIPIVIVLRSTGASVPTDNVGGSIDYRVYTDAVQDRLSHNLISRWSTAADATRTSQFEIWGVNSAALQQHLTLKGTGQLQLNRYGSNTFTGTAAYMLGVDSSGNVIETTGGGGSSSQAQQLYSDYSESESLKQPYEFSVVSASSFPDWYDGIGVSVFEEKLIVFGGWNSAVSYDTVYESADQGVTWTVRGNLPYAVHTPAYVNASDGYTYIIGGDYLNTNAERSSVYRTKDFLTFELRTSTSPFGDRVLHAATELNGVLYCGGGQYYTLNAADGLFTDIYKSEDGGATWTLVSNTLTFMGKNISGSLRTFNNRIYLVGGGIYDNIVSNKTFDKEVYSTADGITWYQEEDIPMVAMQYLNTFVWDGKLWIAGGSINALNLNDTAFMDKSGKWHDYLPVTLITPNHAAGTITFRDKAYVILGNNTNLVWVVQRVGDIYYEGRQVFKSETAIDILRRNTHGYNIDAYSSVSLNENRYTNTGGVNYEKWNGTTLELWPNNVKKYEFNVNGTFYASSLLASTLTTVPYTGTYYNTTLQTNQNFPGIAWIGASHRFVIGLDDDLVGFRLEDNATTGIRLKHKLTTGQTVIEGSSTNGIDAAVVTSAQLAIKSTTRGFLPPVMTVAQRDAIVVGTISTTTITNAGSGYTDGNYNGVPLTGGSGTGGIINVTISGGVLTAIVMLINPGSNYEQGDVLSVNAGDVGGTGSGIQITVGIHQFGLEVFASDITKKSIYDGANWRPVAYSDESPTISSGTVVPATTPAKVGDIYVDTSAKKLYFATGTASSADWTIAN
jgi:uncharacterized protein with FMN-binding domain